MLTSMETKNNGANGNGAKPPVNPALAFFQKQGRLFGQSPLMKKEPLSVQERESLKAVISLLREGLAQELSKYSTKYQGYGGAYSYTFENDNTGRKISHNDAGIAIALAQKNQLKAFLAVASAAIDVHEREVAERGVYSGIDNLYETLGLKEAAQILMPGYASEPKVYAKLLEIVAMQYPIYEANYHKPKPSEMFYYVPHLCPNELPSLEEAYLLEQKIGSNLALEKTSNYYFGIVAQEDALGSIRKYIAYIEVPQAIEALARLGTIGEESLKRLSKMSGKKFGSPFGGIRENFLYAELAKQKLQDMGLEGIIGKIQPGGLFC